MLCLSVGQVVLLLIVFGLLLIKLFSELTKVKVTSNTCLIGKTVLITGGNSGLGYHTALALAGRGARVIIADVNDATESKRKITECTGNAKVVAKIFDLASLDSVRKLAKEIHDEEDRLDILINNAGLAFTDGITADGLPMLMQVNHLGSFLLTHLLIDLLKKSAPSRIIFVSSLMAFTNNLTLENMNQVSRSVTYSYGNTKLCNIITANIFAEKLKSTGVTSNSVHPGLVSTPIYKWANTVWPKFFMDLYYNVHLRFWGKTAHEGAQCQIQCALSRKLTNVTGKYFVDGVAFIQPSAARNKIFAQKVWDLSKELVGLNDEEKL